MALKYPPDAGAILLCRFDGIEPEMTKKRPVVVLSCVSYRLCLVVPLSTTEPTEQKPWHCLINTPDPLPAPYDSKVHWLKGDMAGVVSYDRLFVPFQGKDEHGHRIWVKRKLNHEDMKKIRRCVASALGITALDFEGD